MPSTVRKEFVAFWQRLESRQRRRVVGGGLAVALLLPALIVWVQVKDRVLREQPATGRDSSASDDRLPRRPGGRTSSPPGRPEPLPLAAPPPAAHGPYFSSPSERGPEATDLMQSLLAEAARRQRVEQQQQYERFQSEVQRARNCQTCGGGGNYRYVDVQGKLVLATCPHCHGMGRRW